MGSFKVLRPLAKPKSIYNLKSTINEPIMIRVQAEKIKKNSFITEEVSEVNK